MVLVGYAQEIYDFISEVNRMTNVWTCVGVSDGKTKNFTLYFLFLVYNVVG